MWAAALALIGTGLQLYGQANAAEANKGIGNFNANILEQRALAVDQIISDVQYISEQQEVDLLESGMQQLGAGRAEFASQNVIVGQGSADVWEQGLEGSMAEDVRRLRANTQREVQGLVSSQQSIREQAAIERYRGQTGATAAYVGMASTAIGFGTNLLAGRYDTGG